MGCGLREFNENEQSKVDSITKRLGVANIDVKTTNTYNQSNLNRFVGDIFCAYGRNGYYCINDITDTPPFFFNVALDVVDKLNCPGLTDTIKQATEDIAIVQPILEKAIADVIVIDIAINEILQGQTTEDSGRGDDIRDLFWIIGDPLKIKIRVEQKKLAEAQKLRTKAGKRLTELTKAGKCNGTVPFFSGQKVDKPKPPKKDSSGGGGGAGDSPPSGSRSRHGNQGNGDSNPPGNDGGSNSSTDGGNGGGTDGGNGETTEIPPRTGSGGRRGSGGEGSGGGGPPKTHGPPKLPPPPENMIDTEAECIPEGLGSGCKNAPFSHKIPVRCPESRLPLAPARTLFSSQDIGKTFYVSEVDVGASVPMTFRFYINDPNDDGNCGVTNPQRTYDKEGSTDSSNQ